VINVESIKHLNDNEPFNLVLDFTVSR